jgi:hypothetical protein
MRPNERTEMFGNREIKLKVEKINKDQNSEVSSDPRSFEQKTEYVLHKLEHIGKKIFVGFCIYIVLDTHRQVSVARATYQP